MASLKMIFAILCLILQFIVFLFVLVATPIDAFRGKSSALGFRSCYSMWGIKRCGNHKVNPGNLPYKGFPCKKQRDTMNAAAAFAIFSIFLTLVAFVFTVLNLVGLFKVANIVTLIICAVAVATILICWACMAGALNQKCNGFRLSAGYEYAGSFGLMVTAWILEIIVCVLLFFA